MMKWISVMALTMLFCSCKNAEPESEHHKEVPVVGPNQEDTCFRGEQKTYARYAELKGERELTQDLSAIDVISIFESDTRTALFIGKKLSDIDSLKVGMREPTRYDPFARKVILNELAFAELCAILHQNCVTSVIIDRKEIDESVSYYFSYNTNFHEDGQNVGACYYFYKENILRYFDAVLQALKSSKRKVEYREIINFVSAEKAKVMKFGK